MRVRINYENGNAYEYDSDNAYGVCNAICEHGMYRDCRNEILSCENHLVMANARTNYCDLCPVVKWCNVFRARGREVYAVYVGVGNDTRAHTVLFENREDAESMVSRYAMDIAEKGRRNGSYVRQKKDGRYHFVDVGDTHWTLYVSEHRIYSSAVL